MDVLINPAVAGRGTPPARRRRWPRLVALGGGAVAAILALYVLLPRIAGLDETWGRLRDGDVTWIALAGLFELGSYAGYVVLLRAVAGGKETAVSWPDSWRLTLAGVAASRLLATAGAGGIALTAWALTRMGMNARTVATRMATFFVLLYGIFMAAMVIAGSGLSAGWFAGPSPFALTVVPALFGTVVICAALALARIPPGFGRARRARAGRTARLARFIAEAPATLAGGVRGAVALVRVRDPALLGGLGWWVCDVLVLWAALHAFGTSPPAAVLVMSYLIGQLGNLLPLPGGIGGVEGGIVGALVAFGQPAGLALAAVLTYRAFAFWLPTVPGAVAYVQLTRALGHPERG
jgi:putative heme transporter